MGFIGQTLIIPVLTLGSAIALAAPAELPPDSHRPVVVRVPPIYPELARRMHVGGNVVMIVEVRPDGTVSNTRVESGHVLLRQAAENAVRNWRFAPGQAGAVSVAIAFHTDVN